MTTRAGYSKRGVAKGATGPPTMHLPTEVYELFNPRPPLEFVAPPPGKWTTRKDRVLDKQSEAIVGISQHLDLFDKTVSLVGRAEPGPSPIPKEIELREAAQLERNKLKLQTRVEKAKAKEAAKAKAIEEYDPTQASEKKTGNSYNTVFVGNIPRSMTEKTISKHFEEFGKVIAVKMFPKRYAFVEFTNESDLKKAIPRSMSTRIDGHRVIVDVERSRTVKGWKPKRLGGGQKLPPLVRQSSSTGSFGSTMDERKRGRDYNGGYNNDRRDDNKRRESGFDVGKRRRY